MSLMCALFMFCLIVVGPTQQARGEVSYTCLTETQRVLIVDLCQQLSAVLNGGKEADGGVDGGHLLAEVGGEDGGGVGVEEQHMDCGKTRDGTIGVLQSEEQVDNRNEGPKSEEDLSCCFSRLNLAVSHVLACAEVKTSKEMENYVHTHKCRT